MVEIQGHVVTCIFHNEANKYSVLRVRLDQKRDEYVLAVGYLDVPSKDDLIIFKGEYKDHPKYGKQLIVETYEKVLPSDEEGVIRFLSSSKFEGIGRATAKVVVESLGKNCLELIREDNSLLDKVNINNKKKRAIINGLNNDDPLFEAKKLFLGYGLNMRELIKLDAFYGENLINIVLSNPYKIVEDIDGIGFKTADKLAKYLNIAQDDSRRVESAIIYSLNNLCFNNSSTHELSIDIYKEVKKLVINLSEDSFLTLLQTLVINGKIVNEKEYYYPYNLYKAEIMSAKYVGDLINKRIDNLPTYYLEELLKDVEEKLAIEYSNDQKNAIFTSLNSAFSLIVGGPGTGKTTILYAIIQMLKSINENLQISLLAPTGRASKRMSELTKCDAKTIHSFLEWDLDTNTFNRDANNPIMGDILIVDEVSMVDVMLFYRLLDATLNYKQVILIGDEKQLPPVASGNVLKTLVELDLASMSKLTNIHRQKEDSGIIPLSYKVRNGEVDFSYFDKEDVKFIRGDSISIKNTITKLFNFYIDKGYDSKEIQVLAPKYEGSVGIYNLNDLLQNILNPKDPSKKELQIGRFIFRENDKILQLKNQPDDDVYNGDIGILKEIEYDEEKKKHFIYVDFDGNIVSYDNTSFTNITLGYAISVHKAQGSEYKIVILPMHMEQYVMLKRKLVYTAITRAKKYLFILGDPASFKLGVINEDKVEPNFSLKEKIQKYLL